MSHFKTVIPVDVDAVKKLLPAKATVEKVTFDMETQSLHLHWHHQRLTTPFTFAVDFPIENLKEHDLPEGVTQRPEPEPVKPAAPPVIAALPAAVKAGKVPKPPKAPKAPKPAKA